MSSGRASGKGFQKTYNSVGIFLRLFAFIFLLLSVDTTPIRVEPPYNHKDKSYMLGRIRQYHVCICYLCKIETFHSKQ